jgi:hypothetical protein
MTYLTVIASEAKQSRAAGKGLDCFVALLPAMTALSIQLKAITLYKL